MVIKSGDGVRVWEHLYEGAHGQFVWVDNLNVIFMGTLKKGVGLSFSLASFLFLFLSVAPVSFTW